MRNVLLALFAGLAVGCSSPCDALQKICDQCKDSTTKESCNTTVRTYKSVPTGDTSCQAALDTHLYQTCE